MKIPNLDEIATGASADAARTLEQKRLMNEAMLAGLREALHLLRLYNPTGPHMVSVKQVEDLLCAAFRYNRKLKRGPLYDAGLYGGDAEEQGHFLDAARLYEVLDESYRRSYKRRIRRKTPFEDGATEGYYSVKVGFILQSYIAAFEEELAGGGSVS